MKNIMLLLFAVVLFLSISCSWGETKIPSDIFAYLSYQDGRIVPYKVIDGMFIPIKDGEGKVGLAQTHLTVEPEGNFAFAADITNSITGFKIGLDGGLVKQSNLNPGINVYLAECIVDPTGKYLYAAVNGTGENDTPGGKVAQFTIQTDGSIKPLSPITLDSGCAANRLFISPSGKFLYVGHHWGEGGIRGFVIGPAGALSAMPLSNTIGIATDCTEMTMTNDGENLFFGDDRYSTLVWCSIDPDGKASIVSKTSFPEGFDGGGIMSIAVDKYGNVMIVTPSRFLSTYRMDGNHLTKTADFMCLKDGRFMPKDDIYAYFKGTTDYAQDFEKRANMSSVKRENMSLMATSHKLSSQLQAVRVAPDGFVYVFSTSGVYRFKSTKEGLIYSGPSITWPDSLATIRNLSLDANVQRAVEPIMGGMTFVERKQPVSP